MTVIRAALFKPIALVIHKVTETSCFCIEGIPGERKIPVCKINSFLVAQILQENAHDQSTSVIIRRIPLTIVRDREYGMLKNTSLICEMTQVIQPKRR